MAFKNPGDPPRIGKRWPHKALNFLPAHRVWDFLRKRSGAHLPEASFNLGPDLDASKRILIAMPDGFQENLVAFPVVRSLVRERPQTEFLFLIEQGLTGFLAALLGSDRVVGIRREDLFWGEPHFLELRRITADFRPDVAINFRRNSPALLHFLLRASQARIRVQAEGDAPEGFANVSLRASEPENHLRRFALAAGLWNSGTNPVPVKWARLSAGPENLKEAHARLRAAGQGSGSARMFLWQHANSPREREALLAARSAPSGEGPLILVNGGGPLFPTPPPPADLAAGLPILQVDATGLMLGLFARTRRSIGVNGPLLHLASLADTDVEAHFGPEDRAWDTSWLNNRLKVVYEADQGELPVRNTGA